GVQLQKTDEERMDCFLRGLDNLIRFDVESRDPSTMAEATRFAILQEMKHNGGKLKTVSTKESSSSDSLSKSKDVNGKNGNGNGKHHTSQESSASPSKSTSTTTPKDKGKGKVDTVSTEEPRLTPEEKIVRGIVGGHLTKD